MRITVLTENTSKKGLPVEHGLSLYIEANGKKLLFDTGQSGLFSENAEKLGVDLSKVEFAVLSHGHYDHGGGLKKFFEINEKAPVYMSEYAFEPHYNGERYIGLDNDLDKSRMVFTNGVTKISDGFTLYSCNDREKITASDSFGLNMLKDKVLVPEDFRHEHYLLIEENGKKILISGCSHKGIVNIAEWFKPDVLIGGFHISKINSEKELKYLAEKLNSYSVCYYTCHCTGEKQYEIMRRYMDELSYTSTGDIIEF